MPVVRFQLRNEYALADPELYGSADKNDPEALLEGVAMAGLVGVLRQLGDLAEFAAGIFHNLHEEVMATSARGHGLMLRVQQLEAEFPAIEKAFLSNTSHLHAVHKTGIEWHPNIQFDKSLLTRGDMPRFILDSYEECRGPPRLFMLDKFDVAGAGACLKRYSDPSFFRMDFASTGAMEPEMQREKRNRKAKRKPWRLRNGENPESSSEPNAMIWNHLHPAQIVPAKRAKLKIRPLRSIDTVKRSYMECVVEDTPNEDVQENTPKHAPLMEASVNLSVVAPEVQMVPAVVSSDRPSSLDRLEIKTKIPTEEIGREYTNGRRKNKENQVMVEPNLTDELGMLTLPNMVTPERPKENHEHNGDVVPVKENSLDVKQSISPAHSENRDDAIGDVYVSDDIASEVDNYMDALANIDSEIETDGENKPRRQFESSNIECQVVDSEAGEEKNLQNLQILSFDLNVEQNTSNSNNSEVFSLGNKNSLPASSKSQSAQHEVQNQMHESSDISSNFANKDSLHASSDSQSFQVNETRNAEQENSEFISATAIPGNLRVNSGGENDLISDSGSSKLPKVIEAEVSETKTRDTFFKDKDVEIPYPVLRSSTSLPHTDFQGNSGANSATFTSATTLTFSSASASEAPQQADIIPCKTSAAIEVPNSVLDITKSVIVAEVLVESQDNDLRFLEDNLDPSSGVDESATKAAENMLSIHDACHKQSPVVESPASVNSDYSHKNDPHPVHALDSTPVLENMNATHIPHSDSSDDTSAGTDLHSFASSEKELCHIENHETGSYPGRETTVSDDGDSELQPKSPSIIARISPMEIKSSDTDANYSFLDDASSQEQLVSSSSQDTLPQPEVVLSEQLHTQLNFPSSESPLDTSSTEEHMSPPGLASQHSESKDNTDEFHSCKFIVHHPDDRSLAGPAQQNKDENHENLHDSVKMVTSNTLFINSQSEEGGTRLSHPIDDLSNQERMVSSHDTEFQEPNGALLSEKPDLNKLISDTTYPNGSFLHISAPSDSPDQQHSGEQNFDGDVSPRRDTVTSDIYKSSAYALTVGQHDQGISDNSGPGSNTVEILAHEKVLAQQTMILVPAQTDRDLTNVHECLDDEVKITVTQKIVAEDVTSHSPDVSDSDALHNIYPISPSKQDEDVNHSVEDGSKTLQLETHAGSTPEAHSGTIIEDSSVSAAISTEVTALLPSDSITCEIPASGARDSSLHPDSQLDTSNILDQVSSSPPSQNLLEDPRPIPNVLKSNFIEDSNENTEKDRSHPFKTDCNISQTDASTILLASNCKPFTESIGSKDEPELTELGSSTNDRQVHSEASVSMQTKSEFPMKSLENVPHEPSASTSSSDLPVESSLCINAPEPFRNGMLFNSSAPGTSQGGLDDPPPLPPLPPLQWRMGKSKLLLQGSTASLSMHLSRPNGFASSSFGMYPSTNAELSGGLGKGMDTDYQLPSTENQSSLHASMTPVEASSLASHGHAEVIEQTGVRGNEVFSLKFRNEYEQSEQSKSISSDDFDIEFENFLRNPKVLEDVTPLNTSASAFPSSGIDSQNFSSKLDKEPMQFSGPIEPPTSGMNAYSAMPQNLQMEYLRSNPFLEMPVAMDPRYQYGYGFQPLRTQDGISHHGLYMPLSNVYGTYSLSLSDLETEKANGRPSSILNRPRDPLIEAVASHDRSTLRKVSEIVPTPAKQQDDERSTILDQIKQKSFNLKPAVTTRTTTMKRPATNLKVTAILEKANAIRQAFAGSDDEDNWSDS